MCCLGNRQLPHTCGRMCTCALCIYYTTTCTQTHRSTRSMGELPFDRTRTHSHTHANIHRSHIHTCGRWNWRIYVRHDTCAANVIVDNVGVDELVWLCLLVCVSDGIRIEYAICVYVCVTDLSYYDCQSATLAGFISKLKNCLLYQFSHALVFSSAVEHIRCPHEFIYFHFLSLF